MGNELIGKLVADKYRVERLIRESDTGDVYEGKHDVSGAPVTLRIFPAALAMDPRWSERFLEQARRAAAIDHPNILQITDFGTDSRGIVYAVHEPFALRSLADLERSGEIGQTRALDIARQVASIATVAHARGAVHATLSPKEIFLDTVNGQDHVKVMGFGADTMWIPGDADKSYLAPEQLGEFAVSDERSDIYSLGVILAEMLAGDVAPESFDAKKDDLHPEIPPIITRATARSKEDRYQRMSDLADDLERVWAAAGGRRAAAAGAGNLWKTAAVVFAGIAILGGVLIYATMGKKTDPTTALVTDAESLPVQPISGATGMQEDTLVKMVGDTDAGLMGNSNMALPPGTLPGGDGYNAWSGSGAPPLGAPPPMTGEMPPQVVVPGGQTVTIDPNTPSQFMPQEGGVILVPIPANTQPDERSEQPAKPAANANVGSVPVKPMATPVPRTRRGAAPAKPSPTPKAPSTSPAGEN
jgi:serine/threonine protein kinase